MFNPYYKALFFFTLVAFSTTKVIISNLDYNYIPIDELDYVNYLKYLLGRNDESNIISNGLSSLVSEHRLSLVNSVKRVVLVFTELVNKDDSDHQSENQKEIELKGKLLRNLVFETPQLFIITHLPSTEEKRIHDLITSYTQLDNSVHIIRGEQHEIDRLSDMLNMEDPKNTPFINHPRRLSKIENESNDKLNTVVLTTTYLIKFFFIFVFIFVTIGVLAFISNMNTKKDTLLYAKFIADVGQK